jgi:hypothetical protein
VNIHPIKCASSTDKDCLLSLANLYSEIVTLLSLLPVPVASPQMAPVVALTSSLVPVRLLAVAAAPEGGVAVLRPTVESVAKTPLANVLRQAMLATTVPVVPTARPARAQSSVTAAAAADSVACPALIAARAARAPPVAALPAPNVNLKTSVLTVHVGLTARPARAPSLEIAAAALVSVARALLTAERAVNPPSAHALPTREAFRLTELAERTGKTCKDSGFGDCCSAGGFCGQSTAHCGKGW